MMTSNQRRLANVAITTMNINKVNRSSTVEVYMAVHDIINSRTDFDSLTGLAVMEIIERLTNN